MKELNFLRLRNFKLLSEIEGISINSVFFLRSQFLLGASLVFTRPGRRKKLATPLILNVFFLHFSHHPSPINFSFDAKSVVAI